LIAVAAAIGGIWPTSLTTLCDPVALLLLLLLLHLLRLLLLLLRQSRLLNVLVELHAPHSLDGLFPLDAFLFTSLKDLLVLYTEFAA
jgi:hypothetical protein